MAETLSVSVERVETSVALYLIGAALGQLFGGQLSDRFGRHRVAYAGLALFAAASFGICFVTELSQLFALRLLQAFGGGATVVIAAASVRDFYTGREAARVLTTIGLVMLVAPLLASMVPAAPPSRAPRPAIWRSCASTRVSGPRNRQAWREPCQHKN